MGAVSARREFYEEHGYLLVPEVLPAAEMDLLCAEMESVTQALRQQRGSLEASWPGSFRETLDCGVEPDELRCDSIHDVQRFSARMTRLLTDPRIVEIFVELIGPNVALHHTKYHAKPPETGAPFPLHQDYHYFPHERHTMMLGALYFDDATEANGCIGVVPNSHHRGVLPIVDPGELYLDPAAYPLESLTMLPATRGSMLFFNYLTIHGSTPNRSQAARRALFIQVRDPEDRPTERTHGSHAQGMMLAGIDARGRARASEPG
jgi:phytanoyl-CoA hydroxylase